MTPFKGEITLNKNSRGCYILDTVKGCSVCRDEKPMGCYDNCYALNIANRYNRDFTNTVDRNFTKETNQSYLFDVKDQHHISQLVSTIKKIDMPFIRIGEMGDPSYNWEHTIDVCNKISISGKPIVIITKHWVNLTDDLLKDIKHLDICINTSISALDRNDEIHDRIEQYERLKDYCKSVLRVVSCDFNIDSREGLERAIMQEYLLGFENVLETVFRPSANNKLVTDKIINIKKMEFLGSISLVSMRDNNTFLGYCNACPDMCGLYL